MKGISHKQAVKLIHLRLDGLLKESQRLSLNAHLDSCDSCRTYAAEMDALPTHLQNEFHLRWDRNVGPSHRVLEHVTTRARKIPMTNRISSGIRLLAGITALVFLGFAINFVVSQMQSNSIDAIGTQSVSGSELINNRLIAFTSEKYGNFDIYTMRGDGNNLTNLTNNPAQDANPVWSPDGNHIVFESDRSGITQIYLMAADGSNVVQLTNDNAEHSLLLPEDARFSLWSPDGSRFLFLQKDPTTKANILQSMDINSRNRIILVSDPRDLGSASWSPSGEYVGYVLWDEIEPGGFVPNIYVVESNGKNTQELSKYLSQEEHIFTPYFWSSDGRSIIFPASVYAERREIIYQLDPQENVLSTLMTTKPMLYDWYDGVALGIDGEKESQPLVWQRPDGTSTELDFQTGTDPANCYIGKARSLQGNLVIGSYCKQDNNILLYWTNFDGSKIQQLPEIKVPVLNGGLIGLTLSPDEKFVTFNFESDDETNLYIWNIEDALNDPSVQPTKLLVGNRKLRYIPSWQPLANEDITEKNATPEPTTLPLYSGLITFTAENEGNSDIYTMYADGSNLTNITNYSAHDVNPVWSPDGKRIAFESDRTGYIQIYTMNADGSNLMQITNEEADHAIGTKYGNTPEPWSPDGKKIIFSQTVRGDENSMLYVMEADGRNKIALTREPGSYTFLGWSPDGQKIVYQTPNPDHNPETRIMIANVDGTSTMDGIVGKNFGISSQIQWESPDQLVLLAYNSNVEPPNWQLSRMFVTTDTSVYNGFGPTIVDSKVPIVALFENTYVAEDQDALRWFAFNGSPIPTSPWNFPTVCEKPVSDPFMPDTFHTVSPDRNHAIVVIFCGEGAQFYLENADGTQINQLGTPIPGQSQVNELTWSPDGKHVIVSTSTDSNTSNTNLFRFDVQEMLNDPSVQPVQLTTDNVWKYGVDWQPIASNEVAIKGPTPEPTKTASQNGLITFVSNGTGDEEIYTVKPDGSELKNITQNPTSDTSPVWSPDGKRIAFESNRHGSVDIYIMDFDGINVTRITDDPAQDTHPVWSPDGTKIAYASGDPDKNNTNIYVMDANGQNHRRLTNYIPNTTVWPEAWSPDGQFLFFEVYRQIVKVNVNDSKIEPVTPQNDENVPINFVLSKDGSALIYLATCSPNETSFNTYCTLVKSIQANGENDEAGTTLNAPEICPIKQTASWMGEFIKWSPDQTRLLFAFTCEDNGWLYIANADGSDFKPLTNLPVLGNMPDNEVVTFGWSPDSQSIVFTSALDKPENLYTLNINDALQNPDIRPTPLNASAAQISSPAWQPVVSNDITEKQPTPEPTQTSSADSWIAFTADNNNATNTNMDIYTIRLDGSNLTNLTHDPAKDFNANDYNPAWSPDRKKIAFMSERGGNMTGNANIFVMNRDGNELTQLTYHPGNDAFLSWSPNGERIVYYSSPNGETNDRGQLIVMNSDGSDKTVLTTLGYYYFRSWSPDSQKIVYTKPRVDGASYKDAGIYVVSIDGKNQHEWFIDNIHQIHWEDSEHFLGVVQAGENAQPTWILYQFNTDGSQIELASHHAPIVAIFESTYVVEGQDGLMWSAFEGAPISLAPWNVAEKCETTGDSYISTSLSISPDQKRALVIIYCRDTTWHYLVNEDGSEINQLGTPMDGSVAILPHWSPDGQYVSLFVINYGDNLYLIDIQKMLNDPSATPILLTTNVLAGVLYAEPLIASNDDEEKQTPEPPVFSLSVYAAEKVAFFDVLEPFYLPAGYALEGVAYNPWTQQVAMKYDSQQGNASMLIYQQRGDLLHDPAVSGYVTPVPVGGREGEYIQGAWIYESPDTTTPTWDPRADSYSLTWQNGEFVFSINFIGGETIIPLPLNELVTIAESLK